MKEKSVEETLNSIERSRKIVQDILSYGVTEQCIARIIQGLALNSEDAEFSKSVIILTKNKINSLQSLKSNKNNDTDATKEIVDNTTKKIIV
jgi:hypothetical protein